MNRTRLILTLTGFLLAVAIGTASFAQKPTERVTKPSRDFSVEVLVDGQPLPSCYFRDEIHVEAVKGAEYEVRLRNSSPDRVAVALFVDGLNTIDARRTPPESSSKWVIEPYQTITISGWQMSSERARRFYFTDERDSYARKLGVTGTFGVIWAAFFRERRHAVPLTGVSSDRMRTEQAPAIGTGIGRSIRNEVEWIDMDLDPQPAAKVTIRYGPRIYADERRYCPEPQ